MFQTELQSFGTTNLAVISLQIAILLYKNLKIRKLIDSPPVIHYTPHNFKLVTWKMHKKSYAIALFSAKKKVQNEIKLDEVVNSPKRIIIFISYNTSVWFFPSKYFDEIFFFLFQINAQNAWLNIYCACCTIIFKHDAMMW